MIMNEMKRHPRTTRLTAAAAQRNTQNNVITLINDFTYLDT